MGLDGRVVPGGRVLPRHPATMSTVCVGTGRDMLYVDPDGPLPPPVSKRWVTDFLLGHSPVVLIVCAWCPFRGTELTHLSWTVTRGLRV